MLNRLMIAALTLVVATACVTPSGTSGEDKRQTLRDLRDDALTVLYRQKPEARDEVAKAAGTGVFRVGGAQLGLGAGAGYGIATENESGKETYMRMTEVKAGLGLGVKGSTYVFIFRKPSTYQNFIAGGWEFGATAEAGAETDAEGGTVSANVKYDADPVVYLVDNNGVTLAANLTGTKYWRYNELL